MSAVKKRSGPVDRRALRRAIAAFKRKYLDVAPEHPNALLGACGIVEDEKDGVDRAVVFYGPKANRKLLRRHLATHFKGHLHKLVPMSLPGVSTALVSGDRIAHDNVGGWGTVGGWLKKRAGDNRIFGFSNCHVIAQLGKAAPGSEVMVTGRAIGTLDWWYDMQPYPENNYWDFAVFALNDRERPTWYGPTPTLPAQPEVYIAPKNTRVKMRTENSGERRGVITGIRQQVDLNINGRLMRFDGLFAIQGENGLFSKGGDSGALVTTLNNMAVAVIFAKSSTSDHSYAFPLRNIGEVFTDHRFM